MGPCNRGRKIEDAQAGKGPCQIPLTVTIYRHLRSSLDALRLFSLGFWFQLFVQFSVFWRGVTLNCAAFAGKRFPREAAFPGIRVLAEMNWTRSCMVFLHEVLTSSCIGVVLGWHEGIS
jgi:hypothetical protein